MPLVSAKCTNCGASLEVENTKDAAICPYCDTPYIVEKAVNYYNTTSNITAEVVNVYGGNSADFVIRAGELIKYNGASTDVVIPNSVTMIGKSAFSDCCGLVSVSIPNSVTAIGAVAFEGCSSLKDVVIPVGVTKIELFAFKNCKNLRSITIPNSVTSIDIGAFEGCSSLSDVTIPDGVTSISGGAFSGCSSLSNITIPNSVISIGNGAFSDCSSDLKINASVEWKKAHWICHSSLAAYKPQTQPQSQGGCYIATAVYGSYDCPSVWTLRRYRDDRLSKTLFGKIFIRCYYAVSPTVVRMFGKQKWFNHFWKRRLDKFVSVLQEAGYDDSPYNDGK